MRTRIGELALRVPQARPLPGGESLGFYPKSLERGLRSERAHTPMMFMLRRTNE
jgi:hypothetical protein